MLHVVTWWWGQKYSASYVEKLRRGLYRHLKTPFNFICVTDHEPASLPFKLTPLDERDRPLCNIKGCFARLRMFDQRWQTQNEIWIDDQIVCIDLDVVITGRLDDLFRRQEGFLILPGANKFNPCPFNGSLFMLRAGAHREVWDEFSLEKAGKVPFYEFPDDQGWLHHMLPRASGWQVGMQSGIYAFRKNRWPIGETRLPHNARMVCFPGSRDPSQFQYLPWIADHWR